MPLSCERQGLGPNGPLTPGYEKHVYEAHRWSPPKSHSPARYLQQSIFDTERLGKRSYAHYEVEPATPANTIPDDGDIVMEDAPPLNEKHVTFTPPSHYSRPNSSGSNKTIGAHTTRVLKPAISRTRHLKRVDTLTAPDSPEPAKTPHDFDFDTEHSLDLSPGGDHVYDRLEPTGTTRALLDQGEREAKALIAQTSGAPARVGYKRTYSRLSSRGAATSPSANASSLSKSSKRPSVAWWEHGASAPSPPLATPAARRRVILQPVSRRNPMSLPRPHNTPSVLDMFPSLRNRAVRPEQPPAPVQDQDQDQAQEEPGRKIFGMVVTIFKYIPHFFSVVWHFGTQLQEIVAVQTSSRGNKRRAVAAQDVERAPSPAPRAIVEIIAADDDEAEQEVDAMEAEDGPMMDQPQAIEQPLEQPRAIEQRLERPQIMEQPLEQPRVVEPPLEQPQVMEQPLERPQVIEPPLEQPQVVQAPLEQPQVVEHPRALNAPPETPPDSRPASRQGNHDEAPLAHPNDAVEAQAPGAQNYTAAMDQKEDHTKIRLPVSALLPKCMLQGATVRRTAFSRSSNEPGIKINQDVLALRMQGVAEEVQRREEQEARDKKVDELVDKARRAALESPEQQAARLSISTKKSREEAWVLAKKQAEEEAKRAKEEAKLRVQREKELEAARKKADDEEAARKKAEEEEADRRAELVPRLSDEWEAKIAKVMSATDMNKTLATSVDRVPISRRDLGCLLPLNGEGNGRAGWLNDESINAFISAIVARKKEQTGYAKNDKTAPPFAAYSTAWYTNYKDNHGDINKISRWSRKQGITGSKLLTCEKIFFPLNSGAHWLLIAISGKERCIEVFDSLCNRPGSHWFRIAREWLAMELGNDYHKDEWTDKDTMSSQQQNLDDCGVFTCINALACAKGMDASDVVSVKDMLEARKMIAAVLLNGGFKAEFEL